MIPNEIIKKIKYLEIKTKHIVNNLFGGEYHSAFKGMGMEFADVREYILGDDVKNIDWNVTARVGKPFVKKYNEERELVVMLIIDISDSQFFGTNDCVKSDIIIELASVLSFSAIKNNDKVGLLMFSDKVEKYIPPKKGKSHVLRVIREMIYHKASGSNTSISCAIDHIQSVLKRKCIIFLMSDFWDKSFYRKMQLLNKKHDLINIKINDNAEFKIPNIGFIKFHDAESQTSSWIDTSNRNYLKQISDNINIVNKNFNNFCKKNKIDLINIKSQDGYIGPLELFFRNRIKRYK